MLYKKRDGSMFSRERKTDARRFPVRGACRCRLAAIGRRAVGILTLAVCGLLATACDRGSHPALIGSRAPQFMVADETQTVSLAQLRGRVVLLNFWATWCVPCLDELPSLMELQRRMPQVVVIAISDDEDAGEWGWQRVEGATIMALQPLVEAWTSRYGLRFSDVSTVVSEGMPPLGEAGKVPVSTGNQASHR